MEGEGCPAEVTAMMGGLRTMAATFAGANGG
jgi:hypothetical protein